MFQKEDRGINDLPIPMVLMRSREQTNTSMNGRRLKVENFRSPSGASFQWHLPSRGGRAQEK